MTEETSDGPLPEYPNAREVIRGLMKAVYSISPDQVHAAGFPPMMFLYQGMACGLLMRQEELCRKLLDALYDVSWENLPEHVLARITQVLNDAHKQLDPA